MKRRDFFKVVTGFVAGAVAFALPSKKVCKGLPVQPRESFETFKNLNEFDYGNIEPNSTNIDPNSEGAKQKPLTVDEVMNSCRKRLKEPKMGKYILINTPLLPEDGWIDVRSFGAVVDGDTDDTKAIQEAIDLAKDGEYVYFPKGICNLKIK